MENGLNVEKEVLEIINQMIDEELQEEDLDLPFPEIGVDSLMAMELAVHLERELGIVLSEEELLTLGSANELLQLIKQRKL